MDSTHLSEILAYTFLGNSIKQWLLALIIGIVCFNVLLVAKSFIGNLMKRLFQDNRFMIPRLLIVLEDSIGWFFIAAISIYAGSLQLHTWGKTDIFLDKLPLLALLVQIGCWSKVLIDFKLDDLLGEQSDRRQLKTVATPVKFIALGIIWSFLLLTGLANLGVNVTAFVAGLGIGGIAVALAVQSTLSDLLASLSIAFGKPFMVGDFIILDTAMGTVDAIGLKTTRVRSLGGEMIYVPNSQLINSRVSNFNNMPYRRVVFSFSILNRTDTDTLRKIPEMVKNIILAQDKTQFDRAHFARFGQCSFDFEVVYYVQMADYNFYMDTQQAINLQLVDALRGDGIPLAHPISQVSFEDSNFDKMAGLLQQQREIATIRN